MDGEYAKMKNGLFSDVYIVNNTVCIAVLDIIDLGARAPDPCPKSASSAGKDAYLSMPFFLLSRMPHFYAQLYLLEAYPV